MEKKSLLADISANKKNLMLMRLKLSSGESISLKDYRGRKKDIARLFTKLNSAK